MEDFWLEGLDEPDDPDDSPEPEEDVFGPGSQFFRLFGRYIKVLELKRDFELKIPLLKRILHEGTPFMEGFSFTTPDFMPLRASLFRKRDEPYFKPLMKRLSLRPGRNGPGSASALMIRELLTMCPNLETFGSLSIFDGTKAVDGPEFSGHLSPFDRVLLQQVALVPQPPPLHRLSQMDLSLSLRADEVRGLASKAFALKQLKFGICSDVRGNVLNDLLAMTGNSLLRLILNFHSEAPAASDRFTFSAPLPKLQVLSLCGYRGSLLFLENCPSKP
jgi:hypothetical protein